MSPKFIRYITSTIEEGILSSFRDVTLVKDTLWEKSLLSRMIILIQVLLYPRPDRDPDR